MMLPRLPVAALESTATCPTASKEAIHATDAAGDLQPLKSMLLDKRCIGLQSEAAAALASLVHNTATPANFAPMVVGELQETLTSLLNSSCINVAYPAAILLATLGASPALAAVGRTCVSPLVDRLLRRQQPAI